MRTCIHCGCTDENACTEYDECGMVERTCAWVGMSDDGLTGECSACVDDEEVIEDEIVAPSRELILPGDPEFHL